MTSVHEGKKQMVLEWVYKTKYNKLNGDIVMMKGLLVVKGYTQKPWTHYFDERLDWTLSI